MNSSNIVELIQDYPAPQDVTSIGMDVLRHRVTITHEAEVEEKTTETHRAEDF